MWNAFVHPCVVKDVLHLRQRAERSTLVPGNPRYLLSSEARSEPPNSTVWLSRIPGEGQRTRIWQPTLSGDPPPPE